MRLTFCITMIAVVALAQPTNLPDQQEKTPEAVLKLLEWPTETDLRVKRVPAAATSVASVIPEAERWVRLVVDRQWSPQRLEPFCIEGEFDHRDVVRYRWASGGRSFMVAQTFSVFALEVRPEPGRLGGDSKAQRLGAVTEVCREVFSKTGVRRNSESEEVEVPDFNTKLIEFSFSPGTTREFSNGTTLLAGRPKTMEEEGVAPVVTPADVEAQANKWDKPGWEKTPGAWMLWFRNVYWFADQDRVVIFFLKAEGGPRPLFFTGPSDDKWFRKAAQ